MLGGIKVGRPSIFSREYNRKMRARRIRITVLSFILILVASTIILRNDLKAWVNEKINVKAVVKNNVIGLVTNKVKNVLTEHKTLEEKNQGKGVEDKDKATNKEQNNEKNLASENSILEEKYYEIKLNSGKAVKLIYEEVGRDKQFKNAAGEGRIYFNISPSGKKIIILDEENQDMFFVDDAGTSADITRKQYVSTNGEEIYNKDEQLTKTAEYIWHKTPKFINEDNVVYISNLPWFNKKEDKFLWKIDLSTYEHTNILRAGASSINFDKFTEQGLSVNIDGKTRYINQDGQITE
jgi:hypothetical protein